jgi:hypothetical protein
MKKWLLLALAALAVFGVIAPLTAQSVRIAPENESELFYHNVPIEKVYVYKKGYVVQYRSGVNKLGTCYIPYEWFRYGDDKKAELVQIGYGKTWPCMSVFYKKGEFHSVRLYVSKAPSHQTWGNLPAYTDLDSFFDGVEKLDIKY